MPAVNAADTALGGEWAVAVGADHSDCAHLMIPLPIAQVHFLHFGDEFGLGQLEFVLQEFPQTCAGKFELVQPRFERQNSELRYSL